MSKLVVSMQGAEDAVLSELILEKDQISIGRAAGNDIVLPDVEKRVSSRHARVERSGGGVQIADLGSTNGTFVNDLKVDPNSAMALKSNDRVSIGPYLLRFLEEEDLAEQTLELVDPGRVVQKLVEELPILYARHRNDPPEARREALVGALRSAIAGTHPQGARAVLSQLQTRFRAAESVPLGERGTTFRRRDAEIQKREELYRAGLKGMREISQRLLGPAEFETAEQVEFFSRLITQALELTLEWLSRSLKGRKEFESQFSADLTLIFSKEKNPLKSGGGSADMARFLIDWRTPRSLKTVREALDKVFRDLTMHQLGLLAGVQESLGAALRRLDPKSVENEVKDKGVGGIFASLEKRAWKRYSEIFAEIFAENSKLFNEVVYPNVRKGYLGVHSSPGLEPERPPEI